MTWVMPAGKAWDQGARPGMEVLSVDDQNLTSAEDGEFPAVPARDAELVNFEGDLVFIETNNPPIGQSPMKFSMWVLGGMFALLGAAVVVRRPDLHSARMFGLFSGFAAVAIAVAPSSGGPGPVWALMIQALAVIGVAGSLFLFISAFLGDSQHKRQSIASISFVVIVTLPRY